MYNLLNKTTYIHSGKSLGTKNTNLKKKKNAEKYFLTHLKSPKTVQFNGSKAESCPLGSWVSLWNFETIRGSLMKPNWQKLASLAQEICTL